MTTAAIQANGGTSVGCALQWLLDHKIAVDGIAVVSDGGERHGPDFQSTYHRYCQQLGVTPTVYLYEVEGGDPNWFTPRCQQAGIDVQTFTLRGQTIDDYSLPNLVQTMRVGRYQLLDEILATPLRTLDEVLTRTVGMEVLGGHSRRVVARGADLSNA